MQQVRSKDKKKVITVRTSTFQATGAGNATAPIEAAQAAADPGISSFVGEELRPSAVLLTTYQNAASRTAVPPR